MLTGDGELQEGQFWESLQPTANGAFSEITVIVDHNKIQSDTFVEAVSPLGDLEAKVRAFGWAVDRCDGHDPAAIEAALARLAEAGRDAAAADRRHDQGQGRVVHGAGRRRARTGCTVPQRRAVAGAVPGGARGAPGANRRRCSPRPGSSPWLSMTSAPPERLVPEDPQRLIAAYADELRGAWPPCTRRSSCSTAT